MQLVSKMYNYILAEFSPFYCWLTLCFDYDAQILLYVRLSCTVWKLPKFSLTKFLQKFRESNGFTLGITKELISRNIFLVRENFSFFPHCALVALEVQNCVSFKDIACVKLGPQRFIWEDHLLSDRNTMCPIRKITIHVLFCNDFKF